MVILHFLPVDQARSRQWSQGSIFQTDEEWFVHQNGFTQTLSSWKSIGKLYDWMKKCMSRRNKKRGVRMPTLAPILASAK